MNDSLECGLNLVKPFKTGNLRIRIRRRHASDAGVAATAPKAYNSVLCTGNGTLGDAGTGKVESSSRRDRLLIAARITAASSAMDCLGSIRSRKGYAHEPD